jgi:hypothetical protein
MEVHSFMPDRAEATPGGAASEESSRGGQEKKNRRAELSFVKILSTNVRFSDSPQASKANCAVRQRDRKA